MTALAARLAVLRLLLEDPRLDPDDLDWSELRVVAERGAVIARLADRLARRGDGLPPLLGEAAARARTRAERLVMLVDRIGDACRRLGLPHAFLKVAERYPDAGRDLDLLVATESPAVDAVLLADLPAAPRPRGFRGRLTGSATYAIEDIQLDIHHGRLGQFGEHAREAAGLLRRRRLVSLPGAVCYAPSPEDQILLQAIHQVYTRPAFRVADVHWAIVTLREGRLDWGYLLASAAAMGVSPMLKSYLDYVKEMRRQALEQEGPSAAHAHVFEYPDPRRAGRLYLQHMRASVRARSWANAARLCLLPVIALGAGWHRLAASTQTR